MSPIFIAMVLAWTGTALQIIGAVGLASKWTQPRVAYLIMLCGSLLLLEVAAGRHDWPQIVLMAVFAAINIVGLRRWR